MLSVLRKSTNVRGLVCGRTTYLRQISSELELRDASLVENDQERKFLKPLRPRELKPFKPNFLTDLFSGNFDKDFLQYPVVLNNQEIDSVLQHSLDVESYITNNKNLMNNEVTKDVLKDLKKLNLLGLSIPQEYGGCGYTQTETKFIQECAAISFPISRLISSNEDLGAILISTYGSEEQKQKYLPKIASGESVVTLAYLEKNPLIDLPGFETTSVEFINKDGYLINGKKKWVHNANVSDLILVLARGTDVNFQEEKCKVTFNLFICDKKTPGLTVHELKTTRVKELNLYEVDFKDVFVKRENYLGGQEKSAHEMLTGALAMSQLGGATVCLSLIKRILHASAQYSNDKIVSSQPLMEQEYVKGNGGLLATYAYALESVIYMITGRHDTHVEPDLFFESCVAKILGVDLLQLAVDNYIQILGPDSYKSPGILDEALKVLQYYSVLDENNAHLKLMISSAGVVHAAKPKTEYVKKRRLPFEFPWENILQNLTEDRKALEKEKSKYNLKMELHRELKFSADRLETCLVNLQHAVQEHLVNHGRAAMQFENELIKLADGAVYIYALAAVLARASWSFCNYVDNSGNEMNLAQVFSAIAQAKLENICHEVTYFKNCGIIYKEVGKIAFFNKEYPVAHPIARTD